MNSITTIFEKLLHRVESTKVSWRLNTLVLLPMILGLPFLINNINNDVHSVMQARRTHEITDLITVYTKLLRKVQNERGGSLFYLAQKGHSELLPLLQQKRAELDNSKNELSTQLKTIKTTDDITSDQLGLENLITKLRTIREGVDQHQISSDRVFDEYTLINKQVLHIINDLVQVTNYDLSISQLSQLLRLYDTLMEYAGQERGMLLAIMGNNQSPQLEKDWFKIVSRQDSFIDEIRSYGQSDLYFEFVKKVESAEYERVLNFRSQYSKDVLYNKLEASKTWYELSTNWIDELSKTVDQINNEIDTKADDLIRSSLIRLGVKFIAILLLVLLTPIISFTITRSIRRPLDQAISALVMMEHGKYNLQLDTSMKNELGMLLSGLQSTAQKIDESRALLVEQKSALDTATIVSYSDLNGNISYANDRMCEISGYTREELIGRNHRILNSGVHDKTFWHEMWSQIIKGETWSGNVCNKAKDGSLFWCHSTVMPRIDHRGTRIGYMSVRTDITEQKNMEAQSSHAAKLASIGELAASVAHEINNPLTIVMGNLEILTHDLKEVNAFSNTAKSSVERSELALERIKSIVDGLRTYAKADHNAAHSSSLTTAVRQTTALLTQLFAKENVRLITTYIDGDLPVNGPTGKVQQIIMNLVQNARDATEGKSTRVVTVSTFSENGKVGFTVQDNGSGIPKHVSEKLFKSFITTKSGNKGTGLGMYITNKLIHELGGQISFTTVEGEGTTFKVTFAASTAPVITAEPIKKQETVKLSGRALVVDDNDDIRDILNHCLGMLGFDVDEASDGNAALEKVKKTQYDYIFTDLYMPNMSGIDFLRAAESLLNAKTKVYMVTGAPLGEDYFKEANINATGYITKPFTIQTISQTLAEDTKKKKAS